MRFLDNLHSSYVYGRRIRRLTDHLVELIPQNATVLDVGCGDGSCASLIMKKRPDLSIRGIDVFVRPQTQIPVKYFDGKVIPYSDRSFDVVTFIDVLHHTSDPVSLLREAVRVSQKAIVIKDHILEGWLAGPTLRFMDRVGNLRHGVVLRYNYWQRSQWSSVFCELGLSAVTRKDYLAIYPWPASLLFDRGLHFVIRLERSE